MDQSDTDFGPLERPPDSNSFNWSDGVSLNVAVQGSGKRNR